MMTLVKYFKTKERIQIGSFLSCKIDGQMYVLNRVKDTNYINLVNIFTGQIMSSTIAYSYQDFVTEQELREVIKGLFVVEENKTKEDDFLYWYKLSKQEAIGKFASLVLEAQ